MEKARQNSEMNAQVQQQSIAAKAQADMQLEQIQSQGKLAVVQTEMSMKQSISEQEFVQMALLKSFELGKPLSPEIQQIVSSFFQKKQMENEMEMMQAQAAQEQQSQQTEA